MKVRNHDGTENHNGQIPIYLLVFIMTFLLHVKNIFLDEGDSAADNNDYNQQIWKQN